MWLTLIVLLIYQSVWIMQQLLQRIQTHQIFLATKNL